MNTLVHTPASLAVLLASVIAAGAVAAAEPASRLQELTGLGEAAAREVDSVDTGRPAAGPDAARDRHPQGASSAGAETRPQSRLLRSLSGHAAQPAQASTPTVAHTGDPGLHAAGRPVGGGPGSSPVPGSSGCPRALLASLLESAADADDAVSALAIERETLALCRERQEVVNGIVALEDELRELLTEVREEAGAPGTTAGAVGSADAAIVKVSAPVRVVSLPPPASAAGEAPKKPEAPEAPAPPSYFWFSIIGTAGDLRAGIGGNTGSGGTNVWFVREGDRLPGSVTVTRIVANPPGVHAGGAIKATLPYRPRPTGAAGPRGDAGGAGS